MDRKVQLRFLSVKVQFKVFLAHFQPTYTVSAMMYHTNVIHANGVQIGLQRSTMNK